MLKNNKEVKMDLLMPVIKEKLELGAEVNLVSSGRSMNPLFRHGKDTVCLKKLTEEAKKYDIIFYQRDDGKYVIHRIVGKRKDGYILRGDNQFINEYPVRPDQIIAKVISFNRDGKQISCDNFKYKCYMFVWVNTAFVRHCFKSAKYRINRKLHKG